MCNLRLFSSPQISDMNLEAVLETFQNETHTYTHKHTLVVLMHAAFSHVRLTLAAAWPTLSKSKIGHLDCALYATRYPSNMRPSEATQTLC